ncbi:TetR/AcrR family transcriptional regulator [Haloactinomyces albus]|uniref:AcrR family transcriptional regulator n=1 Tax=Haloactinomyces albus TaxID=1352928 RepID=A0AAE3ZI50_9ACTN|nr:TetR/AcrR family transcriptional regulator [Haloactinomyces albus]MDR7304039.1 AcrR family transcriptional regulator [Haloactinomyces albus]
MAVAKKPWATRSKLDREDSATRGELLTAARIVFERSGYARTTIANITEQANVSRATFYVYFASKQDVFGVLAEQVRDRFLQAQDLSGIDADDPHAVAEATIAAYLDAYTDNLALITVLEHQAITDPAMHALWEEIHNHPRRRTARYIKRLVRQNLAEPAAPPEDVAMAAGGMVAHFASILVSDRSTRSQAVQHLTAMYVRLLGLGPARKA